ncbi:phosphopantetheine-binding protein, partial [Ascidiimonas sp. W6]|uniref:phosphopantetheine-binding protein n=1 Tax=Ascidiimonas meishanensis TaxID=3128903 RepID=UPI0030EDBCA9
GRNDHQVKIRGHRIELGEIENVILKHEDQIKNAVVTVKTFGNKKIIVAYVVPQPSFDKEILKNRLQKSIPNYMFPDYFRELEEIPLTVNGKVNKKALPEILEEDLQDKSKYVAPRNEDEEKMAGLWEEILQLNSVGIHDDFFDLGGNSLMAVRLVAAIRAVFEVEMNLASAFQYTTVEMLVEYLNILKEEDMMEDSDELETSYL